MWQHETYLVIYRPDSDIPVYRVKREDGQGSTRILHRNDLPAFEMIQFSPLAINQKHVVVLTTG